MPEDQNVQNKQPETAPAASQPAVQTEPVVEHHPLPPAPPAPQKRSKTKWPVFGVILLVIVAVSAFVLLHKKNTAPQPAAPSKVTVRLNWLNQAQFTGMYVAKAKGFYKNAGMDVDLKEFQDGLDQDKEVADRKVDFAVTTAPEVINSIDKGDKIKAIAAINQTSPSAIAAIASAKINTPADLKGKVLGAIGGNQESSVLYGTLMAGAGLNLSQATIKSIDFDVVKDFQTNAADTEDIYRTDQTYQLDKAGIKYTLLLPENFGFAIYGDVLVTSDSLIAQNPDLVAKFTAATMQGWSYAIDHEDEALAITAKTENAGYKDPVYEKHILDGEIPLIKPTGDHPIGSMQFVPWNRAYQAIQSAGLLKTSFDPGQVYTSQFVR